MIDIHIDLLTLVVSGVLLLSALLTPMMSPFFRRLRKTESPNATNPPSVTILLISSGDHEALDEHLPLYLTQDYPPGYEVVVVAEKADLDTENVLKRYDSSPLLYHTFVPETSRYMSKNKLAITLGVKAAKNEWIVLTDPRCKPADNHWLSSLASHFTHSSHMVLGYSNYTTEAKAYHRFEQLHTALYLLRDAQSGTAYRTNSLHVSFRKSDFLERQGFLEYLKYSIGEYDFLVNKYGRDGSTVVATSPSTWLWEPPIHPKSWQNRQVYHHEVGKHLEGGASVRITRFVDQLLMNLNYLAEIGIGVWSGLTKNWLLLGVSVAALLITVTLRTLYGKKAFKQFQTGLASWRVVPLELGLLRHTLLTRMRYEYADKNDFISHKV
ncbi:MAG: glycosyl transferase family 2 [Prevotella sp.]|nr:glycosyl transferase family 2 [Prevotella sp.]